MMPRGRQHGADRDPQRLSVKRMAGALIEKHRADAKGRRIAEQGADIVVIGNANGGKDRLFRPCRLRNDGLEGRRRLPLGPEGENAAMHRKACNGVDDLALGDMNGTIRAQALDAIGNARQAALQDEKRIRTKPIADRQMIEKHRAFRDEARSTNEILFTNVTVIGRTVRPGRSADKDWLSVMAPSDDAAGL